jgi:hypothetical protein
MRNIDSLFDISGRTIHSVWLFCIVIGTISCGEPAVPEGPALEEIFAIEVPLDRVRALDRYLAGATLADLHEIEAAADAARPRIDHATGAVLALWWTGQDPHSAYGEGTLHYWLDGPTWAGIVAREWTRTDPDGALREMRNALKTEGGANWQRTISLAVVRGWFDVPGREPGPLLDFIGNLAEGRIKKEALDLLITRSIATQSTGEAIAFVEGLPSFDLIGPSALKQDAFRRLATQLAARDPERALEWAERHSGSVFGEGLFLRVARRWARDDAPAAMAWAQSIPETAAAGPSRDPILRAIVRSWNSVDRQAAAEFLDARPLDAEWKPLFHMSVTWQAQAGDGEGALARIEAKTRLEGAEYRDELVVAAARAWRKRDLEAAEAWLARAGLSAELVGAIRTAAGRPGQKPR